MGLKEARLRTNWRTARRQPPALNRPRSTARAQPPALNRPRSTARAQPPALNRPRSTARAQPPALNRPRSTDGYARCDRQAVIPAGRGSLRLTGPRIARAPGKYASSFWITPPAQDPRGEAVPSPFRQSSKPIMSANPERLRSELARVTGGSGGVSRIPNDLSSGHWRSAPNRRIPVLISFGLAEANAALFPFPALLYPLAQQRYTWASEMASAESHITFSIKARGNPQHLCIRANKQGQARSPGAVFDRLEEKIGCSRSQRPLSRDRFGACRTDPRLSVLRPGWRIDDTNASQRIRRCCIKLNTELACKAPFRAGIFSRSQEFSKELSFKS